MGDWKKELHEGYWKTEEDFTKRWKRNTHIPKKNKLETFLLKKKKESLQIKTFLSAQRKNQLHVLRQKQTRLKYLDQRNLHQPKG